jgi:hypothetical protein
MLIKKYFNKSCSQFLQEVSGHPANLAHRVSDIAEVSNKITF